MPSPNQQLLTTLVWHDNISSFNSWSRVYIFQLQSSTAHTTVRAAICTVI